METKNQENASGADKPIETTEAPTATESTGPMGAMVWWAMLVIAVIAIPAGGIIIATIVPFGGFAQLVVFAIGCWICTWAGMWLMHHSKKFDQK